MTSASNTSAQGAAVAARISAWSEYWATGVAHSLPGSFVGNYEGEIAAFWRDRFDALPPCAEVLDLCCGNAPLARLWSATGRLAANGGRIECIDAARIAPDWIAGLTDAERARIMLREGVDVSALPRADASVDMCVSQFGIEYVGESAVTECRRVLRPRGVLAAVMHHPDSLPVRIAREELGHHAWLERAASPLDVVEGMLAPMARSATAAGRAALARDAQAISARAAYDAALIRLAERVAGSAWPDLLHEVHAALVAVLRSAREHGEPAARQLLGQVRTRLAGVRLRQQELVDCARDGEALRALAARLGDTQPRIDVLRFDGGEIAGWALQAVRPG